MYLGQIVNNAGLNAAIIALVMFLNIGLGATTHKVLHSFGSAGDGANPTAGVTFDNQGKLYGTTVNGGTGNCDNFGDPCGIVFQLTPNADGTWTEEPIHVFNGLDGGNDPNPVIVDRRGNLYGGSPCAYQDCFLLPQVGGVVFQITPVANGSWTFRVIETFSNVRQQGYYPSGLAFDRSGQLFGTTLGSPNGVAFLLGRISALGWYEIVTHTFLGGPVDGTFPSGALAFDSSGSLYGATSEGGLHGAGIVYKLTPNHNSFGWAERILYQFSGGNDGGQPTGIVFDAAGNLVGTTAQGGATGNGTVFQLTPNPDGSWNESVLYSFAGGSDGASPQSAPTLDALGNIYGTTLGGGTGNGIVYELTRSDGQWQETVLHSFTGGTDGGSPYGTVILDNAGNVYGTTKFGGEFNGGTAFEIIR